MVPMVKLSSGGDIPVIAMGTSSTDTDPEVTKTALVEAIKAGYRHIDTAAYYGTEPAVGSAVAEAIRLGLIESRSEIFITTKLWIDSNESHLVLPAINKSLGNLKLEYVDLYLIHWPITLKGEFKFPIPKENLFPIDIRSVWTKMEECQILGLTKAIGVSNFSSKRLDEILSFAKIPPVVNQVEMNPVWQQKDLTEFCREKNIRISAYSPLGSSGTYWGDNRVMNCKILQDIAYDKGKSTAQIALRWLHEQGAIIITKSFNETRMRENLKIFDWSLTEEECMKISEIPQRKFIYFGAATEPCDIVSELDGEM